MPSLDKQSGLLNTLTKTHKVNGDLGKCVKSLNMGISPCDLPISPLSKKSKLLLLCPNLEEIYIHYSLTYHYYDQRGPVDPEISLSSCTKLRRLESRGKKRRIDYIVLENY